MRLTLPTRLVRAVTARGDESGRAWLDQLPALAEEYLRQWSLSQPRPLQPGGRRSLLLDVRQADGTAAVLKLTSPEGAGNGEVEALRHWDGHGTVRLLWADAERGALLLERLRPEISLRSLPEDRAMLEANEVLRRLWVTPPVERAFPELPERVGTVVERLERRRTEWADSGVTALIDAALLARAELCSTPQERLLLHGNFHQGNVLAGERAPWAVLDPEPVVGERAYDLAWLVQDRTETVLAEPAAQAVIRRRLHRLADALDVERARLRGWALFRAVAAGTQALEAGERHRGELTLEFAAYL